MRKTKFSQEYKARLVIECLKKNGKQDCGAVIGLPLLYTASSK